MDDESMETVVTTVAGSNAPSHHVWVDIDNPPQVQYLEPLARAFEKRGARVTVTARDYGITFDLLRARGRSFVGVGRHFGGSKGRKVVGNLRRAARLVKMMRASGKPTLIISNSRSSALAARVLRVPSFVVCDYEHVNLAAYRAARSYIVHPSVIDGAAFARRGVREDRLLSFEGTKEDISFAGLDLQSIDAHVFPELTGRTRRILVRPAAEESHYHRQASAETSRLLLERLAADPRVTIVFSPRYPWQVDALSAYDFSNPPVILDRAVPFLELLKAVDVVVSGGGTMTREAAYLGVPAISTFQGDSSAVDGYLEALGRLVMIREPADVERLDVHALERRELLQLNPRVVDEIVDEISARVQYLTG
jgi:predicted glycosyltransferase